MMNYKLEAGVSSKQRSLYVADGPRFGSESAGTHKAYTFVVSMLPGRPSTT